MKQRLIWTGSLLVVVLLMVMASCGSPATPTNAPSSTAATSPTATPRQGHGAYGTLTKIDGNTLTLTTAQGSVMVNVGSDTTIQKTTSGTLSDLQEGQSLAVMGTPDTNGNITATSIVIRPQRQGTPPTPPGGPNPSLGGTPTTPGNGRNSRSSNGGAGRGAYGTLTKIDGNTLTLTTAQGSVMVNVGSDTTIQKTTSGTLSDLQEGQSLAVMGTPDTNGNITATSIVIRPQRQGTPPTVPGGA